MIHFGTGGFRAIIGEEFTKENVTLIAQALSEKIIKERKAHLPVIIGYDRRFLSDTASHWIAEVISGNDIPVRLIDYDVPTPLVMYTVMKEETAYGMAVTASHNPPLYNGVKLFTKKGRDASKEETSQLEALISELTPWDVKTLDFELGLQKGLITRIDPMEDYVANILRSINPDVISGRSMRILIDPMYGVARQSLEAILNRCGLKLDFIHSEHNPLFGGITPAPAPNSLDELRSKVVEGHYDLGIATDGDADRIALIDSEGHFIDPNNILSLLYYYLHEYKGWKGPVVRNMATTHLLDRMAASFGETCYEVPVGFKWISSMMSRQDALIGGESSGGLTVRGHINGKDSVYAASLLIEMICAVGRPLIDILHEIYERWGYCETFEGAYRFSEHKKREIQQLLFEEKALPEFDTPIARVSYEDGCKIYFEDDSWIICRFSGTEPLLRIFCEKRTMEEAEKTTQVFCTFLGLSFI